MFDKLKGFLDLKGLLMAGGIVGSMFVAYDKIGQHEIYIFQNWGKIQQLEKNDSRTEVRIDILEERAKTTDIKFDKLNESIIALNQTMVKLSTIIENKIQ